MFTYFKNTQWKVLKRKVSCRENLLSITEELYTYQFSNLLFLLKLV